MSSLSAMPDNQSPVKEDLRLDKDGNIAIAEEQEDVRQRIIERLRYWQGEWFINPRGGVPYRTGSLLDAPPLAAVEQLILSEIEGVEGVKKVLTSSISYDAKTRRFALDARVETNYGITNVADRVQG